jgi:hypothetical protein
MHYHPTLATALAQTRVADLHKTAGRARQARRTLDARRQQTPQTASSAPIASTPTRHSAACW